MRFSLAWAVAGWMGLVLGFAVRADTWTNAAGHVVTAKVVAIQGEQVLLQQTNGRTWRMPLAGLKPADQQRVREQTGTERLPSELRACLNQAEEDTQRAAQFLQGGKITREQFAARCETIQQRFEQLGRQALKDRGELSGRAILDRLKHRLVQQQQGAGTAARP